MIKFENYDVSGWEYAIRGMRNPMNSWEKSDSGDCDGGDCRACAAYKTLLNGNEYCVQPFLVGPNDRDLMMRLRNAGTDHRKFMRMITVYVDITAPLYWWKEFDTYKVGTVANSCSTMHKIHEKEFTLEDFSCDHLLDMEKFLLKQIIDVLNEERRMFIEEEDKDYWWQMIQLLPSSYNQKRTVMLNYEVLANIYKSRKTHKLDEWRDFCVWIEELPYGELITGKEIEITRN